MAKIIFLIAAMFLYTACVNETNDPVVSTPVEENPDYTYRVVDTNVNTFYSNSAIIEAPVSGGDYYGQDAHYTGNIPSYTDKGDGTVTDNVTGLMWQKDMGSKITFSEAEIKAASLSLGGYSDWRVPTIKELYSLILFTGEIGNIEDLNSYLPYLNTEFFIQPFGNPDIGERYIDAQQSHHSFL